MVDGSDWAQVRAWRKVERQRLVAVRSEVGVAARAAVQANVAAVLATVIAAFAERGERAAIAFYWPIKGEIALFGAMQRALALGASAALPFIPGAGSALQFRRWAKRTRMVRGIWDIPTPEVDERLVPNVLLVPVVGFDAAGHRLGNGGGFYDRTLAALPATTLRLGIGFQCLRLPSIHPQPHDVPMDLVITEAEPDLAALRARAAARPSASPPCALGELPRDLRGF